MQKLALCPVMVKLIDELKNDKFGEDTQLYYKDLR